MGGDTLGRRPAREPEAQVQELQPEVQERAAARLLAPQPPAELLPAGLKRVPPAADRLQHPEVAASEKPAHRLDIRAKAVVHAHHHALAVLLARLQYALHAREGEREGALAQHVTPRRERGDGVNLVQVVRRADRDGIRVAMAQHFFDVVERVLHLEARGEGLGLAHVVVADRGDLDARQLAQDGKVRHLRDRPRPYHRHTDGRAHRPGDLPPRIPAQRYITPVRRLTVERPLDSTPRASSVTRQRFAPNSAPSVPFKPAVI